MKALQDRGGRVTFPALAEDPLWRRITLPDSKLSSVEREWFVGTLPNRFRAQLTDPIPFAEETVDPCTQAVRASWKRLADAVWEVFVAPVAKFGHDTKDIWQRQIETFWEITWVIGPDPKNGSDGSWLDRRKNWRTHVATLKEPGDHCRMFGDLQELSGWVRARSREERIKQDEFWRQLARNVKAVIAGGSAAAGEDPWDTVFELLELRETERLCAPALIKRLFPCLPSGRLKDVFGWLPKGAAHGTGQDRPGAIRFWPSTAHMAAVPWMRSAWQSVPDACRTFAASVQRQSRVEAVAEQVSAVRSLQKAKPFGSIDGGLLFEEALASEIAAAERDAKQERVQMLSEVRQALLTLLQAYSDQVRAQRIGRQRQSLAPVPFYALLVMDGDHIGRAIRQHGAELSQVLAQFGRRVPEIVDEHDGALIYAGGDDVQAFLPVTEALPCALKLRQEYENAVQLLNDRKPTISAGLIFAHFHIPLGSVIREAHRLLDDEAKDGNGRDSIAIAVRKPSGTAAQFVTRFHEKLSKIHALAKAYAVDLERSTGFLYHIKDRYEPVMALFADRPQDLKALLLAEWLQGTGAWTPEADRRVDELAEICWRIPGPDRSDARPRFDIAAGLIARFLAEAGVGTLDLNAAGGAER